MSRLPLLAVALGLALPAFAAAQGTSLDLVPRMDRFPLTPGHTQVSVHRYPDGETLAALRLGTGVRVGGRVLGATQEESLAVVLVRTDPRGRVRWARPLRGRTGGRFDKAAVVGLPDGGAIVHGHGSEEEHTITSVLRLDADGAVRWRWDAAPTGDFSAMAHAIVRGDALIVSGSFSRGGFQLPGGPAWRSPRYLSHYLATGEATWARLVPGGIEETALALTPGGTILFATHGGRRGDQELIVRRFDLEGEAAAPIRWGTAGRDDFPHGVHAADDEGFAVLVATTRPGERAGEALRLVGFDAEGEVRFVHDVPDRSVLVRSAPHAVASVVAPTRVRRERRMSGAGVALWAEGAYVLGVDGAGRRVIEQPVPGAARSWLVGSLRGDGGPDGIWLSGVARHGRRVQVAFGPVGGPRVTAPRSGPSPSAGAR
ncbi:MAG TPA: hypothetical protein RMG95_16340, partial [Polyangiaceae bacterium LLY-WYZ-15_(1-7)]|nr:hypothetical protein [Polyangiaceae bacterium LLY-WYZ-15_(1-7)]